jgi:hypothetical protein
MFFVLRYPGTWIEPRDEGWVLQQIISSIQDEIAEATLSLIDFEHEQANCPTFKAPDLAEIQGASSRRQHIEQELFGNTSFDVPRVSSEDWLRRSVAVDEEILRRTLEQGILPKDISSRRVFVAAKSFALAAAAIERLCKVAGHSISAASASDSALRMLADRLPGIKGVRHSLVHVEDRRRGQKGRGKPIDFQPIDMPGFVQAPAGLMIGFSLVNHVLCITQADGTVGQLPIDEDTVATLTGAAQILIDGLMWTGPPSIWPRVSW